MKNSKKKYALFSVNSSEQILHFANVLISKDWSIIATDLPYKTLKNAGIEVISVSDFVGIEGKYGFPPTLHPKVEYLLTDQTTEVKIELVYDITYELDTGNDVGGHTLLALAAKGNRLPVSSYDDMREVISLIEKKGIFPDQKRQELISKAQLKVASHYLGLLAISGQQEYDVVKMKKEFFLLNGENPYQVPSDLMSMETIDPLSLHRFQLITDNVPCFTNMADVDCILGTLCKLAMAFNKNKGKMPFITIAAKHGNPCGIGIDWNEPAESIRKALWGNPLAIWGGEVLVNFPLLKDHAGLLFSSKNRQSQFGSDKWMLDVILAPDIDIDAQNVLKQRKNTKIFINKYLASPKEHSNKWAYRFVRGGVLRQPPASYNLNLAETISRGEKLSEQEIDSLIIAWACSFTSNHGGNEISIANNGCLLGAGGGPSTVEAAEIAVIRSSKYNKKLLHESIFAADAFFPFIDAPEILCNAGCVGGIVPSGGIRQKDVMKYFHGRKTKMVLLNDHIRGFCRH